jgi:hypothetical protein
MRHSQRKRRETDRQNLRSMAPVLDPTTCLRRFPALRELTANKCISEGVHTRELRSITYGEGNGVARQMVEPMASAVTLARKPVLPAR